MVDLVPDIIKSVVARVGPPGSAGNQIFSGTGPPPDPYPGAYDGDLYLDTVTGTLYELDGPVSPTGGSSAIAALRAQIAVLEDRPPELKVIMAGRHYGPLDSVTGWNALENFSVGANFLNAGAFLWPEDAVLVNVKIPVVTPQPGATIHLSLYSFGATKFPDAEVLDLGVADLSAAGDRLTPPVNVALPLGIYYLAGAVNVAGVQLKAALAGPGVSSVFGHLDTSGNTPRSAVVRSATLAPGFTDLPATFGPAVTGAIIPAFWLVAG